MLNLHLRGASPSDVDTPELPPVEERTLLQHFVEEIAVKLMPEGHRGIGTTHTQRTDALGLLKPVGGAEGILSGKAAEGEDDDAPNGYRGQPTVGQETQATICDREMAWIEFTAPSEASPFAVHKLNVAAPFSGMGAIGTMDIRGLNQFAPVLGCTTLAHKDLFGLVSNPTLLCTRLGEKVLLRYTNFGHAREMINSVRFMYSESRRRLSVFVAVQNGDFLLVELDSPNAERLFPAPSNGGAFIEVDPDKTLPRGQKNNCTRLNPPLHDEAQSTAMNDFAVHRYLDGSGVLVGVSDSPKLVVARLKAPDLDADPDASSFEVAKWKELETITLLENVVSGQKRQLSANNSGAQIHGSDAGGFFTYVSFSTDGKKFAASADIDKFIAVFGYTHSSGAAECSVPLEESVQCLHTVTTQEKPYRLVSLSTSAFACVAGPMLHFVDVPTNEKSEYDTEKQQQEGESDEEVNKAADKLCSNGVPLPSYELGEIVDTAFALPRSQGTNDAAASFTGIDVDLQTNLLVATTDRQMAFFRVIIGRSGAACTLKREASQWLVHKARITNEECQQVPLRLLDGSLRCQGGHFLHYLHTGEMGSPGENQQAEESTTEKKALCCSSCKETLESFASAGEREPSGGGGECLACPQCDVRYCRVCSFTVQRASTGKR